MRCQCVPLSPRNNPLGMRGEVAEEFSFLLKTMWCGQYRSISPRDFKVCMCVHACVCVSSGEVGVGDIQKFRMHFSIEYSLNPQSGLTH